MKIFIFSTKIFSTKINNRFRKSKISFFFIFVEWFVILLFLLFWLIIHLFSIERPHFFRFSYYFSTEDIVIPLHFSFSVFFLSFTLSIYIVLFHLDLSHYHTHILTLTKLYTQNVWLYALQ